MTGWSYAKFPACGFCVCGMSKKPTPLMDTTAPSGCHWFVGLPHCVSNFFRTVIIALRSRALFGMHCAAGIFRDQVSTIAEQHQVNVAVAFELELGDLCADPPHASTENSRSCFRRGVRLRKGVDRRDRGGLRSQVDKFALRVAQHLQPLQPDVAAGVGVVRLGWGCRSHHAERRQQERREDERSSH